MRVRERNYPLFLGLLLSLLFVGLALFGPALAPHNPMAPAPPYIYEAGKSAEILVSPYAPGVLEGYPLGTDEVGRDILSRILWGVRPTLVLSLAVVLLRLAIGVPLGLLAGWYRGLLERSIDLLVSMCVAIPLLIFAVAVIFLLDVQRGLLPFLLALVLTGWADTAALVKTRVLAVREAPYMESARALGVGPLGLLWRHVLRQLWPLVPVVAAFELSAVVLLLAELGFLGVFIGGGFIHRVPSSTPADLVLITSGMPELGQLLSGFWAKVWRVPWEPLFVGPLVVAMIVGFNLLGEGLRRRLDITRPRAVWWRRLRDRLAPPPVPASAGLSGWSPPPAGLAPAHASRRVLLWGAAGFAAAVTLLLGARLLLRDDSAPTSTAGSSPQQVSRPVSAPASAQGTAQPQPSAGAPAVIVEPGAGAEHQPLALPELLGAQLFTLGQDANGYALAPIDPLTLEPLWELSPQPDPGRVGLGWIGSSRDGALVVSILFSRELPRPMVTVVDGRTGEERNRFEIQGRIFADWSDTLLSADGSILFVSEFGYANENQRRRYVIDTATGERISEISGPVFHTSWINPQGTRLYGMQMPNVSKNDPLKPATLYAYDLRSGKQLGRLELPEIGGRGKIRLQDGGDAVQVNWQPAAVLTPDGRQLVVLHATRDAMTIVDAESMQVARTVELTRATDLPPLASELVGQPGNYTLLNASMAPDGKQLYVVGEAKRLDASGRQVYVGLGLRVIDIERAQVVREQLIGTRLESVVAALDGRSLYVIGPGKVDGKPGRNVLRHIDAQTLEVTAARDMGALAKLFPIAPPPQ